MSILDAIRDDIAQITSDPDGFGTPITFSVPKPSDVTATVVGIASRHHLGVDTDGNAVNSMMAHCSVAESLLTAVSYPLRNDAGDVDLRNHRVSWTDSAGQTRTYIINEFHPDETVGLILIRCGDFEA